MNQTTSHQVRVTDHLKTKMVKIKPDEAMQIRQSQIAELKAKIGHIRQEIRDLQKKPLDKTKTVFVKCSKKDASFDLVEHVWTLHMKP